MVVRSCYNTEKCGIEHPGDIMDIRTIELRRELPVENGGHILYVSNSKRSYIENLAAYIADGIKLGHRVLIIDETEIYQEVYAMLVAQFSERELESVFFTDNRVFFQCHDNFHCETILHHYGTLTDSLPEQDRVLRSWAQVVWREQEDIINTLENYENTVDIMLEDQGMVVVCAYDGTKIPAELLVLSLKNHEYFMTDTELVRSPLYSKPAPKGVFPSLSIQAKIESEMDFYKKKLDFVHVVSHEVRNPLTIVNAYASMIGNNEANLSAESRDKLMAIEQYVKAIDHELTHIIETEQMLSNELFMKLGPVSLLPTIQEVIRLMEVKSYVQNVIFACQMNVLESHHILGNAMGLRLILSNLISNAIKYTNEQGLVEFSAHVEDQRVRFVIRDTGMGMSPNQLKMLYQKYGKLDESHGGQGIGLYIVKHLTDRFHGTLHMDSALGEGTTVTVDFPLLFVK